MLPFIMQSLETKKEPKVCKLAWAVHIFHLYFLGVKKNKIFRQLTPVKIGHAAFRG